ncbi:MAG: OmpH family outer membrane protein [Chloracidobacterium sp.]|nr:OmpH family outer membrane protein [Chloracidobacterium sp.]
MSIFRSSAIVLVSMIVLSLPALAQTAPPKSVLINTSAFFDEKAGITRLTAAEKQINTEFAATLKKLQDDSARLSAILSELQNTAVTAANQTTLQTKKEEGERLQRTIEYNKANLEADVNKRRETLLGPIRQDIGNAITEFGKKNGYSVIFDTSKLAEAGALLFVAESTDATKDFIAFYNSRTAAVPVR